MDTVDILRKECRLRGLPTSGTKTDLLHTLQHHGDRAKRYDVSLDPDQLRIVDEPYQARLIVSAGPGAGKTTTIVHLLQKMSSDRCLVLAFNRAARDNLKHRLKRLGVSIGAKAKVMSDNRSVFVMSFDEFAYQVCAKDNKFFRSDDYLKTKQKALRILPSSSFPRLDLLVIDEAQDMSSILGEFIDQLAQRSRATYIFGDPRQELYPGCSWFSSRWTATDDTEKAFLRYNHRSGKEIVRFLNEFSRTHFPTLHHDQIATRPDDGEIDFYDAEEATECMIGDAQYSDLCFLSPISIQKYNLDVNTNNIRQVVYGKLGIAPRVLNADESNFDIQKECIIATSKKFKGLEKDVVMVYGIDRPYTELNIPWETLVKSLFVCLSRAKDRLLLLFEHDAMRKIRSPITPLLPTAETITEVDPPKSPVYSMPVLGIADDLADVDAIEPPEPIRTTRLDIKHTIESEMDKDVVAIYVRNYLASALGCLRYGRMCNVDDKQGRRVYRETFGRGTDRYKFLGKHDDTYFHCREISDLVASIEDMDPTAYQATVLDYSNRIKKPWTVSARLEHREPDIEEVMTMLPGDGVQYRAQCHREILCGREGEPDRPSITQLMGVLDFSAANGFVVDVRYGGEILPRHRRACGIYAWIMDIPYAHLIDLRSGIVERIPPVQDPSQIIHALVTMRIAKHTSLRLPTHTAGTDQICVALDFETVGFTDKITEVGAVRYNPSTGVILGVYHDTAAGVVLRETAEEWSRITGLSVADEAAFSADQARVMEDLHEWCGEDVVIHWAGSEKKFFKHTLDAHVLYVKWSDLMHARVSTGNDLSSACERLFCGSLPFKAHRALDDAIATMAVHVAITEYGGTL